MIGESARAMYHSSTALSSAIERVQSVAAANGVDPHEAVLRWVQHHSVLKPEFGDALVAAASSPAQLNKTMNFLAAGPLPKKVADTIDGIWESIKETAPEYSPFLEGGVATKWSEKH
jgi:aflatoxin B1 aldehyde reductase